MSFYVDVHTHLTHEDFAADRLDVIKRAKEAGLGAIVVNGLEPQSNRLILDFANTHDVILPALGIYPLDAICQQIPEDFIFKVTKFDVDAEIQFIRACAQSQKIIAVGECGLDGYYLGEDYLPGQIKVFEELIGIAMESDIPVIIHTRKCERLAGEILASIGAKKVNFHCFGGRSALAKEYAEKHGWYFSIPSNCTVNEGFQKMLKILPIEQILTETDAPYLAPKRGDRNEPATVVGTVNRLADYRGISPQEAKMVVHQNFERLFQLSQFKGRRVST